MPPEKRTKDGDAKKPTTSRQPTSAEKEIAAVQACLNTTAVVNLATSQIFRQASVPIYKGIIPSMWGPNTVLHSGGYRYQRIDDADGHLKFQHSDVLIGRYVLEYRLGKGTFGQVVDAYDEDMNKNVAIKISSSRRASLICAGDEIAVLDKLNGYNGSDKYHWVQMLDYMEFWDHRFIVLEKLADDLYSFMKKRNECFHLHQIRHIASQLLWCLIGLQNNLFIHTDLDTHNICLVNTDSSASYMFRKKHIINLSSTAVKVIDFGCAIMITDPHRGIRQKRYYRCPEVIFEMKWGYPIDVWSVGCILYELYTGDLMFPVYTDAEHINAMETILGPLPSMYNATNYYQGLKLIQPSNSSLKKFKPLRSYMKSKAGEHDAFFDLLSKLLEPDPDARITPRSALRHRFFTTFRMGH